MNSPLKYVHEYEWNVIPRKKRFISRTNKSVSYGTLDSKRTIFNYASKVLRIFASSYKNAWIIAQIPLPRTIHNNPHVIFGIMERLVLGMSHHSVKYLTRYHLFRAMEAQIFPIGSQWACRGPVIQNKLYINPWWDCNDNKLEWNPNPLLCFRKGITRVPFNYFFYIYI
jgi:hypothetical protein